MPYMKIVFLIVVIAGGLYVASMVGFFVWVYFGLFSAKHYREVSLVLEKIRDAAGLHIAEDDEDINLEEEDPRRALTSRSLAMAYSISHEEGRFVHHLSVSLPKREGISIAAGEMFISLFVWRLGFKPEESAAYLGFKAFHLEVEVQEEDHFAIMDRSLEIPGEMDLNSIRADILRVRRQIEFFDGRPELEAEYRQIATVDP